jgi:hypothetical protein
MAQKCRSETFCSRWWTEPSSGPLTTMSLSSIPLPIELQSVVHFGLFEADLHAGEPRKGGMKIRIQDLPFRALTLLLSRPMK